MSYNGSGTFQINSSGQPVITGTTISSTVFNALTADLATGLSTAITKDGQTTTTARIPFALGINSTLVTDATNTTSGSIITAGGVGIAKALYVGTTANVAGAVTLGGVATFSAQPIFSSLTASSAVATDASKGLVSVTNTGTGNNVLATTPTIATPSLTSPTISDGTANGVGYLNGSKVLTTGSTLAFDGTTLSTSGLTASGTITASGGTANGVGYLNGSKVLTTGSALTWSGSALAVTGTVTTTGTAATNTTGYTAGGTTTGFNRGRISNTGGDLRFGIDSSVGSEAVANSAAYSSFIGSFTSTPLYFVSNSAIAATIDTSGNLGLGVTPVSQNGKVFHIDGAAGAVDIRLTNNATGSGVNNGALFTLSGSSIYLWNLENNILSFGTNNTEQARIDSSGNFSFNSGYGSSAVAYGCRAWVNFNGTGTIAIRASGNVTSITDNGVGDYTVNFTTAMPDANYSVGGAIKYNTSTTSGTDMRFEIKSSTAMTASAFTVVCSNYTGTLTDMNTVVLNVFR